MENNYSPVDWALVIGRGFESKDLDYKAPCSWDEDDKRACCNLVKDILAMANTLGGKIVIGVEETSTGFKPVGITAEEAKSFEVTRVSRFANNYTDPPINLRILKPVVDGKQYVVIEVPVFTDTPHVCQKDFPGVLTTPTIYIRTDNNESAPLKNSADFRAIVEKSVRNRSDQLISSFQSILRHGVQPPQPADEQLFNEQAREAAARAAELNPHRDKQYAYRASDFFPSVFDASRFNLADLRPMATNACVDLRGWPYIFIHETRKDLTYAIGDGYETVESEPHPFNRGDTFHFWQLRRSGLLYAQEILRTDTVASVRKEPATLFDFDDFSIVAGEAVHCLVKLYEGRLDDSEEVVFRFRLAHIGGRFLGSSNPNRYLGRHPNLATRCRIPEITYEARHAFAEWRAGIVDHAIDLCKHVFTLFNWESPALGESRKLIEGALSRQL